METLSAAQTEVPGRLRMDSWPALPDDENTEKNQNPTTNQQPTDDDWNFIDDPDDDEALAEEKMKDATQGGGSKGVQFNPKILYRCASTPDFGNYDEEPSASHGAAVDADSEDASVNADPSQDASATEESENDSTAQQPPASNPAATSAASAAGLEAGGC